MKRPRRALRERGVRCAEEAVHTDDAALVTEVLEKCARVFEHFATRRVLEAEQNAPEAEERARRAGRVTLRAECLGRRLEALTRRFEPIAGEEVFALGERDGARVYGADATDVFGRIKASRHAERTATWRRVGKTIQLDFRQIVMREACAIRARRSPIRRRRS